VHQRHVQPGGDSQAQLIDGRAAGHHDLGSAIRLTPVSGDSERFGKVNPCLIKFSLLRQGNSQSGVRLDQLRIQLQARVTPALSCKRHMIL